MNGAERKWAPNPYSIAELLVDDLDIDTLFDAEGHSVDQKLRDALQLQDKRRATDALQLFQQIAQSVKRPTSISEVMALESVRKAAELYGKDNIERLLPYLVPVADVLFAASESAPLPASAPTWFKEAGPLLVDDVSYLDPIQGAVGDCYLISALIALAWSKPEFWSTRLGSSRFDPPSQKTFQWQFHGDDSGGRREIKTTGRVPVAGKNRPRFARTASAESWPALIEKAWVVRARAGTDTTEPSHSDYQAIERGATPPNACEMLVGGKVKGRILNTLDGAKVFSDDEALHSASGVMQHPVMAWTKEDIAVEYPEVWEMTGLWPNHAYAVLGVMPSKHVVLRNPHGVPTEQKAGYAEGPWQVDGREDVKLNKNGVFAISPELFYQNFENIGWVINLE